SELEALERSSTLAQLPNAIQQIFKTDIATQLEKQRLENKVKKFMHRHQFSGGLLVGALLSAEIAATWSFAAFILARSKILQRPILRGLFGFVISFPLPFASIVVIDNHLYGLYRTPNKYVAGQAIGLAFFGLAPYLIDYLYDTKKR